MFPPFVPQLERERLRLELERIEKQAAYWANVEPQPRNYREILSRILHLVPIFKV